MFMKRIEIVNLFDFFQNLKLNKFGKEIRSAIISNHLKTNRIVKEAEESINETRKKLLEGKEEEINKLAKYRDLYKEISEESEKIEIAHKINNECKEALSLEAELVSAVNEYYGTEIEIELTKIDQEKFIDECSEADIDITPSDLIKIEKIFK